MSVPSSNTTVTTERPYFETERTCVHLRQAGHRALDRDADVLLDLHGRERGGGGDDLDLDVGDVGDRVDRELQRARTPTTMNSSVATSTRARLRSDHATMAEQQIHG
jgi:hypothetical protein